MRIIASRLWQIGEAEKRHLISVHDIDLNDAETLSEVRQINPSLENADAHDIAAQGKAVAEIMDQNLGGRMPATRAGSSSWPRWPTCPTPCLASRFPSWSAISALRAAISLKLKSDVLEKLATAAWYLHSNRDGKLFFKNVENLNAKLESSGAGLRPRAVAQGIAQRLTDLFKPVNGWCYQDVLPLPAIDEIELAQDRTTIVVFGTVRRPGAQSAA